MMWWLLVLEVAKPFVATGSWRNRGYLEMGPGLGVNGPTQAQLVACRGGRQPTLLGKRSMVGSDSRVFSLFA